MPYAQGYGEISYKWPRGSRLSLGMLYEGSNNTYAQPAFVTFNSNLELSLGPKAKFQISVENLFNAMDNRLPWLTPEWRSRSPTALSVSPTPTRSYRERCA
jgi:TonB dependent receptor